MTEKERLTKLIEATHETVERLEREVAKLKAPTPKRKATRGECMGFAIDIGIPAETGEKFFLAMEDSGWTKNRGKVPVLDWKATMRNWVSRGWLDTTKTLNGSRARL